jgi:hypothetical protein
MVMVYKAKDRTFDINKIQIIVPADESAPGSQPSDTNIEQENAQKALEKELGGETKDQGNPPSEANPGSEQDDAEKALQKELGGATTPEGKK